MKIWDEDCEWAEEEEAALAEGMLDEEEEEDVAPVRKYRNLAQMERDGEAASAVIDAMLRDDPDVPSKVLLEAVRKHARPMSEYRPTEAELFSLRQADILYRLRKKGAGVGEEDEELSPGLSV